ncbi:MAG TPA: transketolase C-terminal domain-containing protein [Anaerolineaceae bacterium]|nr:transketolase C-terminal domain-containing protein [Anaerolineaceae bacterium]
MANTYVDQLREGLHQMMADDRRVVVLGEDILDPYGGAFKVTRGLSSKYPDRVLTTPISEAAIAGVAVGLAIRGLRPIAEFMFGDFITLAADQIVNHAAKYIAMYPDNLQLSMVLRTPMGGGRGYGPTHSQSLEKLFLGLPMLHIVAPSHFHDPADMLRTAISNANPVLFLENKLLYPQPLRLTPQFEQIQRSEAVDDLGYACVMLENYPEGQKPDVALVAYGGASRLLEPLLNRLAGEEIWIKACLPGCLSPLPIRQILQYIEGIGRVIVVEEGTASFGWSAEVSAQIYDAFGGQLAGPILRLGAAETVIPASKPLEDQVLLSEEKILSAVFQVMAW